MNVEHPTSNIERRMKDGSIFMFYVSGMCIHFGKAGIRSFIKTDPKTVDSKRNILQAAISDGLKRNNPFVFCNSSCLMYNPRLF